MPEETFEEWAERFLVGECRYVAPRALDDTRWAAANQRPYQSQVLTGEIGDETCIADFWCYSTFAAAIVALETWDGTGEPTGWFRHTPTSRRVAQGPGEFDKDGVEQPVGSLYRRP